MKKILTILLFFLTFLLRAEKTITSEPNPFYRADEPNIYMMYDINNLSESDPPPPPPGGGGGGTTSGAPPDAAINMYLPFLAIIAFAIIIKKQKFQ